MVRIAWSRVAGLVAVVGLVCAVAGAAEIREVPFEEGKAPPPPKPGKVWCMVTKPAVYKTESKEVVVRKATHYVEKTPAVYGEKFETVETVPAHKVGTVKDTVFTTEKVQQVSAESYTEYEIIPAKFGWETVEVVVRPSYERVVYHPPVFETKSVQVEVAPARTEVVEVDCDSAKRDMMPGEKQGKCYATKKCAAQYQTVQTKKLVTPAKMTKETVPAVTRTVKVRKVVEPAKVKKTTVPAKMMSLERQVVKAPATVDFKTLPAKSVKVATKTETKKAGTRRVEVPAITKTITSQVLAQPAMLVWREVDASRCSGVAKLMEKYCSVPGCGSD